MTQWLAAATIAILLHGTVLLGLQVTDNGAPGAPPGPAIQVAASSESVFGEHVIVEAKQEAPPKSDQAVSDPSAKTSASIPVETIPPEAEPEKSRPVAALDPSLQMPESAEVAAPDVAESIEPPMQALITPPARNTVIERRDVDEQASPQRRKSKPPTTSEQQGKGKTRAGKRGNSASDRSGAERAKRSGGRGRRKANPGAVASFKSHVRARIASCARSRLSGRGGGRVVIRFGVSASGGAKGVSASGSAALRSAAVSAARGCSFPRPPSGAGGMRFAFPVAIR